MASTSDGQGYWLVADDGGVFAFGDAVFAGSGSDFGSGSAGCLRAPTVGMAADLATGGYWLVESDGSVFACSRTVPRIGLTSELPDRVGSGRTGPSPGRHHARDWRGPSSAGSGGHLHPAVGHGQVADAAHDEEAEEQDFAHPVARPPAR